ncbi:unnamed protein product [Rotaria magnacalcarata]|uniref:NELL2-like EGF domain-containing protein n=2 Tax=Rotaria magnacalcarata TaxID=392030 RepID=A0A816XY97_9BILA|nr:unnamed protein product [Rotaria magnacalcarata]
MVLHGRLLYAWLPLLVFLLQAFHGRFAEGGCSDNNGDCGANATCSYNATTSAVKCTCKAGYTNTGSAVNVVCIDSCTVNNGDCGANATCSYNATINAVECTCTDGYIYTGSASQDIRTVNISANANWAQNGLTIAGGNGAGGATNQLNWPYGFVVDDDQTVIIADSWNNRIMQWTNGDTTNGQVVAGGNGAGSGLNQLTMPTNVLIDNATDSLIICDPGNQRVVRWSRRSGTIQGEILIDSITCYGLAMDEQIYLYVSDYVKQEVRRYQGCDKIGILVAGGNGQGSGLNQLSYPTFLFVDGQQNVYVSEWQNHRVMKWNKGAIEGIVVAGGQGAGSALTQLNGPLGIIVDTLGALYVVDEFNYRAMRWTQGATQGTVIVGDNGQGAGANQFYNPYGVSFDRYGNLFVLDAGNGRVQRFSIE